MRQYMMQSHVCITDGFCIAIPLCLADPRVHHVLMHSHHSTVLKWHGEGEYVIVETNDDHGALGEVKLYSEHSNSITCLRSQR